jgi:hypothetical protein
VPQTGWLAESDVLADLSLPAADNRLPRCIAAAEETVSTWRAELADWPEAAARHPAVYQAGVQLAALLWESNVTPEGFAGFSEAGGVVLPGVDMNKWHQIRRLARAGLPRVG